jgi:NAD-dependent dihydropyrimidine dehydrogenase PreA subunit
VIIKTREEEIDMSDKVYMVPNPPTPNKAVEFNPEICNGCKTCVEICRNDVLMPNPEKGKPPIVLYHDECWYCGSCVEECPRPGAIKMVHPLNQSIAVSWKRKDTGEICRLGMKNPPPPNMKPPLG